MSRFGLASVFGLADCSFIFLLKFYITQTYEYSHVTLRCVNVIKQGFYCHPFNGYTALENK